MLHEIVKAPCHIQFDEAALNLWSIPITAIKPIITTREASDSTLRDEPEVAVAQEMPDKYPSLSRRGANTNTSRSEGTRVPSAYQHLEESLEATEAVQKMGNALKENILWWIIEIIPTYHERQDDQDEWVGEWGLHFGRGRELPSRPLFHESVKTRMSDPVLDYSPRAQYEKGTELYVS